MDASNIVIAGGSGLIGRLLASHFESQGRRVVVLSRSGRDAAEKWDGRTVGPWARRIEGADAVINLCGASVVKRWTADRRRELIDSRVLPTLAIGEAVRAAQIPPRVWINASAVGYYGDAGDRSVTEATRAGEGFMAELAQRWEGAFFQNDTPSTRKVCLRIGVVLHRTSQFVRATSLAAKLGLLAPLGTGRHYVSWIHASDLVRMVEWCLQEQVTGPLNACAPNPVTNSELAVSLRRMYDRPPLPGVPRQVVRALGSLLGKEAELLLTGQRAIPEIALARGFRFRFERLEDALDDVLDAVPVAWKTA